MLITDIQNIFIDDQNANIYIWYWNNIMIQELAKLQVTQEKSQQLYVWQQEKIMIDFPKSLYD